MKCEAEDRHVPAAECAHHLAELADALDEARRLVVSFDGGSEQQLLAKEL